MITGSVHVRLCRLARNLMMRCFAGSREAPLRTRASAPRPSGIRRDAEARFDTAASRVCSGRLAALVVLYLQPMEAAACHGRFDTVGHVDGVGVSPELYLDLYSLAGVGRLQSRQLSLQ